MYPDMEILPFRRSFFVFYHTSEKLSNEPAKNSKTFLAPFTPE